VFGILLRPFTWSFGLLITGVENGYAPIIRWCIRNRALVYLLALFSMGFTAWGVMRLDNELIPAMHQGEFTAEMTLPVGTPLEATDDQIRPLEDAVLSETPHIGTLTTIVGSERDNAETTERGEHTARFRVTLDDDDPDEALRAKLGFGGGGRARAEQIEQEALDEVRRIVGGVPDMEVKVSRPVLFSFKTPVEVELRSSDLEALAEATAAVQAELASLPELRDVKASIQPGSPEVHIIYDRDALTRRGLDIRRVAELVRDKVQGTEATKYNKADRKVPVRVRLQGADEASLAELRGLVVNPSARMTLPAAGTNVPSVVSDANALKPVPLSAVATLEVGRGPNEIRRIGQQRVGVVTANVEGVGLGSAADSIRDALRDMDLPPGVDPVITGQSEEWETSSRSLYLALALSVFLVYVIMAAQFESLIYPLIILLTIPLAFVGVVATLLIMDLPLSVIVFLGAIMLAGIVVNNAIVLVDYVGTLKSRGYDTAEALELAGRVRLRPILMTTLTTVLGLVPMAMGLGDGAEIRMPMAITVISGLSCSTLLTLLVIPTLYAGVDRLRGGAVEAATGAVLEADLAQVRPDQLAPETADEAEDDD
jgi:HAE1 family hydrophobic/amphiphilic exporter-1